MIKRKYPRLFTLTGKNVWKAETERNKFMPLRAGESNVLSYLIILLIAVVGMSGEWLQLIMRFFDYSRSFAFIRG